MITSRVSGSGQVLAALGICLSVALFASAQERQAVPKSEAAVVVDGTVRQVFSSPGQSQTDYVVEIEVRRVETRRAVRSARAAMPVPDEPVYVHLFQRRGLLGRAAESGSFRVPEAGAQVRAYLTPRTAGGWEGTFPDWFEAAGSPPVVASPRLPRTPAGTAPSGSLGMTTQPVKLADKLALRVTSVERSGPAREAGLEVGDIIAAADGAILTSADQLERLALQKDAFPVVVVDVNTGRAVQVQLQTGRSPAGQPAPADDAAPAARPDLAATARSLGLSAERVLLGERSALKVLRVEPGSPCEKAGLEPGDIIVKVNGAAITSPDQLAAILRKSGPVLTVHVRDVRTGREVPVEINVGGAPRSPQLPADLPPTIGRTQSGGRLGVVTELAFYDIEAAVKITEVEAGSAAARAGLTPGLLILRANGKPVLHPNDLAAIERDSGGQIRLTVVDPRTGRKSDLNVRL